MPSCPRRSAGGRPGPMGKRPPWARRCRGPETSGDGWDFIQDGGNKWGKKPRGNGFLMFLVILVGFS